MNDIELKNQLQEKVAEIEKIIYAGLPEEKGYARTVFEAMNYSVKVGGKRLRPMLVLESYRMFSGNYDSIPENVAAAMCAIEYIHTYSLVHDDLPAMDNDEYRRGHKTTWNVYGDAMGILAGDGLLNYAFETILKTASKLSADGEYIEAGKTVRAADMLANKAGSFGMIGGQTADLEAEGRGDDVSLDDLLFIHEHKTACLIEAALMMGAVLGGAGEAEIKLMEECGHNIGIAFQIQDDILDIIGTLEELGKEIGSDAENDKVTYVTINGMEKSVTDVLALSGGAIDILKSVRGNHDFLEALVLSLTTRRK